MMQLKIEPCYANIAIHYIFISTNGSRWVNIGRLERKSNNEIALFLDFTYIYAEVGYAIMDQIIKLHYNWTEKTIIEVLEPKDCKCKCKEENE